MTPTCREENKEARERAQARGLTLHAGRQPLPARSHVQRCCARAANTHHRHGLEQALALAVGAPLGRRQLRLRGVLQGVAAAVGHAPPSIQDGSSDTGPRPPQAPVWLPSPLGGWPLSASLAARPPRCRSCGSRSRAATGPAGGGRCGAGGPPAGTLCTPTPAGLVGRGCLFSGGQAAAQRQTSSTCPPGKVERPPPLRTAQPLLSHAASALTRQHSVDGHVGVRRHQHAGTRQGRAGHAALAQDQVEDGHQQGGLSCRRRRAKQESRRHRQGRQAAAPVPTAISRKPQGCSQPVPT